MAENDGVDVGQSADAGGEEVDFEALLGQTFDSGTEEQEEDEPETSAEEDGNDEEEPEETEEEKKPEENKPAPTIAAAVTELKEFYKLPPKIAEQFNANPSKMLPELLARVHLNVSTGMAQQLGASPPALIQRHMDGQALHGKFAQDHPDLQTKKATEMMPMAIQLAKAANPKGTKDQILAAAANTVRGIMGKPAPPAPKGRGSVTTTKPQPKNDIKSFFADLQQE